LAAAGKTHRAWGEEDEQSTFLLDDERDHRGSDYSIRAR
jgi:hypothetical protein